MKIPGVRKSSNIKPDAAKRERFLFLRKSDRPGTGLIVSSVCLQLI